jgi:hypothetical protein
MMTPKKAPPSPRQGQATQTSQPSATSGPPPPGIENRFVVSRLGEIGIHYSPCLKPKKELSDNVLCF